jgi:hypothetical protein
MELRKNRWNLALVILFKKTMQNISITIRKKALVILIGETD